MCSVCLMSADKSQTRSSRAGASRLPSDQWMLLLAAWLIASLSSLSALFIGEVMGQMPCLLCWYQRIFMFPLAVILTIALYLSDGRVWRYGVPLSVGGLGFALYHSALYGGLLPKPIVPCSKSGPSCTSADMSIFSLPLPYLSVLAFASLLVALVLLMKKQNKGAV